MFTKQNGECAICHRHQYRFTECLSVDHLHVEGYSDLEPEEKFKYVRGLLCRHCNRGLGMFEENKIYLLGAIKYLKSTEIGELK